MLTVAFCLAQVDTLGKDIFLNAAKTSISSKIIGACVPCLLLRNRCSLCVVRGCSESEFFAKLAVDAMQAVSLLCAAMLAHWQHDCR